MKWAGMLLVGLAPVVSAPAFAAAQDLFDRLRDQPGTDQVVTTERYHGRDRMDLRVGGSYPTQEVLGDRGYAAIGLNSVIDSDFACGRFDIKANLKSLLGKEARDDFVETLIGAVESELMYNALVLACEVSPTACDALKHFRANSNALLAVGYDRCQAIESAINDGLQSAQAQAIKACVERKRQQGVADPNEALTACRRENRVSGLLGDETAEFDLGSELEKVFDMDPGTSRNLQRLLSKVRIRQGGVAGEVRADAVLQEYRTIQDGYIAAWTEATDRFADNPNAELDPELRGRLYPRGLPGVLPVEAQQIAQVPEEERRVRIAKLASDAALVTLTMRIQELERKLAAAAHLPQNNEGRVRQIEQTIASLRLQLTQIEELAKRVEQYNQEYLNLAGAAQGHESANAARAVARGKSRAFVEYKKSISAPIGTIRRKPTTERLFDDMTRRNRTGHTAECCETGHGTDSAREPVATPPVNFGSEGE